MNKKLISLICIILIVTTPLTLAQFSETEISPQSILYRTYGKQDLGEAIVVNVAGYEPSPIASASIESGITPVFVYLQGTTFGTLASTITGKSHPDLITSITNIPPIKSMTIQPDKKSLDYLASPPKYIKPKRNAFSLNNLGQVILNLKQIPKEDDVPDKIKLNFTATITFDLEQGSIFGISEQSLILKQYRDENAWLELPDSQKDTFFAGRGFIRMSSAEGKKARFFIYDKFLNPINIAEQAIIPQYSTTDLTKESTKTLREGEVSEPIVLGDTGDLFLDSFRIRLNQIIEPQDKAYVKLTVYGNTYDKVLIRGKELYPGSNWKVRSIYIEEKEGKKLISQKTTEFIKGVKEIFGYRVTLEDLNLPKNLNSIYTTTHVLELENRDGDIAIIKIIYAAQDEAGNQNILDQLSKPLSDSAAESIILKYCLPAITKTPPLFTSEEQRNIELEQSYYVCQAIEDYKKVLADYPSTTMDNGELFADDAAFNLGEIFSKKLIPYPKLNDESYFSDMRRLALHYFNKVSDKSKYYLEAQEKINSLTTTIGGSFFLTDEAVGIELKRIQLLTPIDKPNAEIIVDSKNPLKQSKRYNENEKLEYEKDKFVTGIDSKGEFDWVIESISSNSVILRKKYKDGKLGVLKTVSINEETQLQIKEAPTKEQEEYVYIKVTKINANVEADITILPGIGEAFSTSTFEVHLPIDKRPFKFSKEQLEDQIKKTEEMIKKLDNTIEKLDKLVTSLKKTCLVVATALIIKNSFFTGAARNLARKEIMKVYDEKCKDEIAQGLNRGKYKSQDGCYQHYSSEIEDALDEGEDAVEDALNTYKQKIKKKEGKYTDEEFNNYILAGGTPEDYKTYLIYQELSKTSLKDEKNFEAAKKLVDSQIEYDIRMKRISLAQELIKDKEFKTELEKQAYLQFLIHGLENPEIEKAPTTPGTGETLEGPRVISNLIGMKDKPNEFHAIISKPDVTSELFELARPSQLSINIQDYNNDIHTYKKALTDLKIKELEEKEKLSYNEASARATSIIDAQLEVERSNSAVNNFGQPLFIEKNNYDITGDIITGKPKYFTSNLIPFVEGQSVRNEYLEQTSYRHGGQIISQFTTDGYVYCYPLGQGDYALVNNWFKTGLPDLSSTYIYNIGPNGRIECGKGDDVLKTTPHALEEDKSLYRSVSSALNRVSQCKKEGDKIGTLKGTSMPVICSYDQARINEAGTKIRCTDTMDPNECRLLFNVCDPVMCPPSRCNLGGRWQVDNVIGSGLIGSTVLCLPNRKDGVMIPVCLTGISAGLRNIRTILQGYQACLKTSLEEGRNVGLCDYIRSIGICEIVWKEFLFITRAKGGVLDWAISKVAPNSGGEEYTRFRESFDQASKSFNYFTTEYSQSLLAQYKGKSFEEIGTEVCKLAVNGKIPNLGDAIDELSQPEDPPQFTAVFDEMPAVTQAGVNQYTRSSEGLSYYRGFYHIYAGRGYEGAQLAPTGYRNFIQYSVYLKSTRKPLQVLFVTKAGAGRGTISNLQSQIVRSSVIKRGEFVQESINAYAESGYDQICVVINGKTSCGFGKASSAFGLNALQDYLVVDEAERGIDGKPITTEEQCRPDYPRTSPSLGSLVMPQQFGMLNTGIIRVCNPTPPAPEDRWRPVGDCGYDKNKKYLGKCWLDLQSISINDAEKRGILATDIEEKARNITGIRESIVPYEESKFVLTQLNQERIEIKEDIKISYDPFKKERPLKPIEEPEKEIEPKEPKIKEPTEPIKPTKPEEEEPGQPIFTDKPKGPPILDDIPNIEDIKTSGGCRYDGLFKHDSTSIIKGKPAELAEELKLKGVKDVYVYTFASLEGTTTYNQDLSNRRAAKIKNILKTNGLNVISAIGEGETARFDPEDRKISDKELANKAISENRRFVISIKPITNFLPAPLSGTTTNCETLKKPSQLEEPLTEELTTEYKAIFENGLLKKISGNFKDKKATQITVEQSGKTSFLSTNDFKIEKDSILITNIEKLDASKRYVTITVYFSGGDSLSLNQANQWTATGQVIAITGLQTEEKLTVFEEPPINFKEKVLNKAREFHDQFTSLRTEPTKTIKGEDLVKGEYSYEYIIKFSANPKISAEALLQKAEFYKEIAEFIDELIGYKPEIKLKERPTVIKAQFTAETEDQIKITGDFDFSKYDYFITITDKNEKKTYITAAKDKEDVLYTENSITLKDKYSYLLGNIDSILITVYVKGTSDYPLTSIPLTKADNFGKGKVEKEIEAEKEEVKKEVEKEIKAEKEEFLDKCAECHEGWTNPCSKEECNEISKKEGIKCTFIPGIFSDKCISVEEAKKEEIEEEKLLTTDKLKIQLEPIKYEGKKYYYVLFDQNPINLKVLTYGTVFENDITKFGQKAVITFYNKLVEKDKKPILVVNGGIYSGAGKPEGIVIDDGKLQNELNKNVKSPHIRNGVLFVTDNNKINILKNTEYAEQYPNNIGIKQAVQGNLLFDNTGYYNTKYSLYPAPRNTIGINCSPNKNQIAFVQTALGEVEEYKIGKFLRDQLGCEKGINLDGGGSTSLKINFGDIDKYIEHEGSIKREEYKGSGRMVSSVIAVFAKEDLKPQTKEISESGFSFLVLSDIHEDQTTGTLNKILSSINPSLSSKPIKYIILNGDLIMKGGKKCGEAVGDLTKRPDCYKEWYNKIKSKADSLGIHLLITPGNHDYPEALDYYKEGIQAQIDGTALITLDYKTRDKFNADLDEYDKSFVFSHVPFVDHEGAKDPALKLSSEFINELRNLKGQCALISGHSHVYATKEDSKTGCLGVGDGVAGGDLRGQKSSYTLVEVYLKEFKVCQINQDDGFKFNENRCTSI